MAKSESVADLIPCMLSSFLDSDQRFNRISKNSVQRSEDPFSSAPSERFITVADFASIVRLSRRTLDRYRRARPKGFPKEYDATRGIVPLPRFKLAEVLV